MSDNSEEDEFLPEKPARLICSECEKLKKEFDFTTIPDDNDTKSVYKKRWVHMFKMWREKVFPHNTLTISLISYM